MNRVLDELDRAPRVLLLAASALLLAAFSWIDFATGPDVSFLVFYLVPLYLTAWHVGRPAALGMGIACAVLWLLPRGLLDPTHRVWWNLGVQIAFFLVVGQLLHGLRRSQDRRFDERIRSEHERMALALGVVPEGVVLLAGDGAVLVQNESARRLVRLHGVEDVAALGERLAIATRIPAEGASIEEFETEAQGRNVVHVIARRGPRDPTAWILRDVTVERQLLVRSIHEFKMADLGLLAAGIAHEIGNPLSSISAILQLLRLEPAAGALGERLDALDGHVQRVDRIVRMVTGFARGSGRVRAKVHAGTVLDRALEIFRFHHKSKGIELDVAAFRRDVVLEVVEDEIVQIVLNLLLNAVDGLGGRGTIRIACERRDHEARFSVSDEGAGMDAETLGRIFTPFFTTKPAGRGTGLGLAVSQTLVVANGGRIEVRSSPGTGSVFTVCLPSA